MRHGRMETCDRGPVHPALPKGREGLGLEAGPIDVRRSAELPRNDPQPRPGSAQVRAVLLTHVERSDQAEHLLVDGALGRPRSGDPRRPGRKDGPPDFTATCGPPPSVQRPSSSSERVARARRTALMLAAGTSPPRGFAFS